MTRPVKILVVDDDPNQVTLTQHLLLAEGGFETLVAYDGLTALSIARQEHPDLILSDYRMPKMDGFTLCTTIKQDKMLADTMFILVTAADDVEKKVSALEHGADDYITKPFHTEELVARVKAILRLKALQDELREERKTLAQLNAELEESFHGLLGLLTELIDRRIPNAALRADQAIKFAAWIGNRLKLSSEHRLDLELAARLHEIGKVNLHDELLRKPFSELSAEGKAEYRHFPLYGHSLLVGIPRLKRVGVAIRHQLENYDGTGYPDRLIGEEIPLIARVLRVVTYLEEMTPATGQADQAAEWLTSAKGLVLEPSLALLAAEYVNVEGNPAWLAGKRQVGVTELLPGMVVAADLYTSSGTKLLAKDAEITPTILTRILSHHQLDPIMSGIYVYEYPRSPD